MVDSWNFEIVGDGIGKLGEIGGVMVVEELRNRGGDRDGEGLSATLE